MWPFKSKKDEAQQIWDTLSGKADPKDLDKMIEAITSGKLEEAERLFHKHLAAKTREYENSINN